MNRLGTILLTLACLASPALAAGHKPRKPKAKPPAAAQPTQPAPKQEPPPPAPERRIVVRPWMLPPYAVLGLPRDALDAPSKLLSSIPVFKRVFMAPLMVLNTVTTLICWSGTEESMAGGIEAWVACINPPRMAAAKPAPAFQNRRWWRNYFPNWRTFGVVYWKPLPPPPEPAAPPPTPAPQPPSAGEAPR